MTLSAGNQIITNAAGLELVSGGASNPRVISGVADPSVSGLAAEKGTLYLRSSASGEAWIKYGATNFEWVSVGVAAGAYSPPERWAQINVTASQTAVALAAQVSGNTNTIRMASSGSIVGLATQLTEAITAGTLTVTITKNGAPVTLSIAHASGTGSQLTQAVGVDTYIAGDLLGIQLTTDAGFLPITTDIEAWIQCSEAVSGTPGSMVVTIGGGVVGSTVGSVLFVGAGNVLQQDNANLFWDNVNNRLGVGTAAPAQALHVVTDGIPIIDRTDTGTTGAFGVLSIQHSTTANMVDGFGPTLLFRIKDDTSGSLPIAYVGAVRAGSDFNGDLVFAPYIGGSPLERLRVSSDGALQVTNGSSAAVSDASTGRILYNTTGQKFQISKNGVAYEDLASLATRQVFTAAQDVAPFALTYGANISVNASFSNTFTVTLTGATAQLDNPTSLQDGQTFVFRVLQDGTGGRGLTFGTNYDFGTEGSPTLTTSTAGKLDIITAVSNGTKLFCTTLRGFTP
jgi:hypothetical protein